MQEPEPLRVGELAYVDVPYYYDDFGEAPCTLNGCLVIVTAISRPPSKVIQVLPLCPACAPAVRTGLFEWRLKRV